MHYWEIPEFGAQVTPHELAVINGNTRLSWHELLDRRDRVAALVSSATSSGARVGVLAHNGFRQPELYYGISKAGRIVVPLNWRLTGDELRRVADDAGLEQVFADESCSRLAAALERPTIFMGAKPADSSPYEELLARSEPLREPASAAATDPAMIAYTSGTTGEPKGVVHTHSSLIESAVRLALEMRVQPADVFFGCLPLFFAGANSAMTAPLLRGCSLVIDDFSPQAFAASVEEEGVTNAIFVPTMLGRVGEDALEQLRPLRYVTYAGAPVATRLTRHLLGELEIGMIQLYGQLESGLMGLTLHPEDHRIAIASAPTRLASAGKPTAGLEFRLRDVENGQFLPLAGEGEGEICLRGPTLMAGYWNKPQESADAIGSDGWLRTGDIGSRDSDGFVSIVDRLKDMIITGGINVYSREIEELLSQHPRVDLVGVVGLPSEEWGEEITAVIQLQQGASAETVRRELLELCEARLAPYKKPRHFFFDQEIPLTGSGKVAKNVLRKSVTTAPPRPSTS